jgi:hypothetical protein
VNHQATADFTTEPQQAIDRQKNPDTSNIAIKDVAEFIESYKLPIPPSLPEVVAPEHSIEVDQLIIIQEPIDALPQIFFTDTASVEDLASVALSFQLDASTPVPDTDDFHSLEEVEQLTTSHEILPTAAVKPIDQGRVDEVIEALELTSTGQELIEKYRIKSRCILGLGGFGVVYAGYCADRKMQVVYI